MMQLQNYHLRKAGGNRIPPDVSKSKSQFRKFKGVGSNFRNELVQSGSQNGNSARSVPLRNASESNKPAKGLFAYHEE
jgi:hypothetical protein